MLFLSIRIIKSGSRKLFRKISEEYSTLLRYEGGTWSGIGASSTSRSIPNGTIILFKYYNFIYFMGSIGNVSNRRLVEIRDRLSSSKVSDQYYIYEIKEIVNKILSWIWSEGI